MRLYFNQRESPVRSDRVITKYSLIDPSNQPVKILFLIQPNQLLMSAGDSQLDNCIELGFRNQLSIDGKCAHDFGQFDGSFIFPNQTKQAHINA
jgi:hypothetical protein